MRDKPLAWIVSMAVTVAFLIAVLPAVVEAQTFTVPRNQHDQPDLQGIWQAMNSAHYNVEPHGASYMVPGGTGVIIDPSDGKIPYTAAGMAEREENRANLDADPYARCYKPGTPHLIYLPFAFQIVQSENFVTVMSEYVHNTRFIFLNRDGHYGAGEIDLWNGDSVGNWEGDTLVTDVFNFHPDIWLDRAGNHSGPRLRVNERFTLIDRDTIQYQATMTDAENYTQPWTMELYLYRHKEPNKRILEYECHAYADNALGNPVLPTVP